jgi:flagellar hook-associated protein 2
VTDTTDRESTLAGDPSMRALQQRLHDLITTVVNPNSPVRTLADLGLKSDDHTGQLSIDSDTLTRALANDTGAVNAVFQQASTGLSALTQSLVSDYTDPLDGVFVAKQNGLTQEVKSMDDQLTQMQDHIDAYKKTLLAQFTQMETVIGGLKSVGDYLTQQEAQDAKKS